MATYLLLIIFSVIAIFAFKKANSTSKNDNPKQMIVSRSGMKEAKYSGNMFSISNPNRESPESSSYSEKENSELLDNDFLGKAASVGHKAKDAVRAKKYDEAWGLYHKQKSYYMKHANQSGFTPAQVLALDSSVHEELANILRLEGKHHDALISIVYWVISGVDRPTKRHGQKLQAYFKRCRFTNTSLESATKAVTSVQELPQFTVARSIASEWVALG